MGDGYRIVDSNQPCLGTDGDPDTGLQIYPAVGCEIIDAWHTAGLCGTGSHLLRRG
jgi:hypothetical protein